MARVTWCFVILIALWSLPAEAKSHARGKITLRTYEDLSSKIEARDIVTPTLDHLFKASFNNVHPTHTQAATWVSVDYSKGSEKELALKVMHTRFESVDVFIPTANGLKTYGLANEPGLRRFLYVPLPADSKGRLYLRLKTHYVMTEIPILLIPQKDIAKDIDRDLLSSGIYYGIILIMIVYNLFLFIFVKDRVYLVYTAFLMVFCTLRLSIDGYVARMIDSNYLHWKDYFVPVVADLSALVGTLYTSQFLSLKRRAPALNTFTKVLCSLYALALVLSPFIPYEAAIGTTYLIHAVLIPYLVGASVYSIYKGYLPARFFLVGLSGLIVANVYVVLFNSGLLASHQSQFWDMDKALNYGSIFEMIFFSFALADRITHFEKGRRAAQDAFWVADLKRREAELLVAAEAEKAAQYFAIAQMTQSLAHDVRKPFSMLKMGLDRLGTVGTDPAVKAMASKIKTHVGRAFEDVNGLIMDVMEVSSGQSQLHQEEVSLREMIEHTMTNLFRYQENCSINFTYDLAHSAKVYVDVAKVLRVFANIVDNARQAMKGEGVIWFATSELESGRIEVVIGNTGSFIPMDQLGKIFDAFFTNKKGGTGLGLAISKKITEAHGGAIRCESDAVHGTRFILSLPVGFSADASRLPLPPSSAAVRQAFEADFHARAAAETLIILPDAHDEAPEVAVIDDDVFILDMWENILKSDCKVHAFASPEHLLERLAADPGFLSRLRVLVTDHYFDGSDLTGSELGRAIKELSPTLPVLLSSDATIDEQSLRGGIDARIAKLPVTLHELNMHLPEVAVHRARTLTA